jgi:hypothetical protein
MEDEASPSTPLHLPGTGQAQSASTPEQPRRHHPGDDDTSNHPNEDDTQDSHGPHKRHHPEQDEEPSDVPAPKPKCGRGSKGARGGRGAKAKVNSPNAQPAIDQEVCRSVTFSSSFSLSSKRWPHACHQKQLITFKTPKTKNITIDKHTKTT